MGSDLGPWTRGPQGPAPYGHRRRTVESSTAGSSDIGTAVVYAVGLAVLLALSYYALLAR